MDVSFESASFVALRFFPPVEVTRYFMSSSVNGIEHNAASMRDRMAVCDMTVVLTYLINPIDASMCVENLFHLSHMFFLRKSGRILLSPSLLYKNLLYVIVVSMLQQAYALIELNFLLLTVAAVNASA